MGARRTRTALTAESRYLLTPPTPTPQHQDDVIISGRQCKPCDTSGRSSFTASSCHTGSSLATSGQSSSHMESHRSPVSGTIFNELRLEDELCDVVICVDNVEFRAHKIILCSCSNYFRSVPETRGHAGKEYFLVWVTLPECLSSASISTNSHPAVRCSPGTSLDTRINPQPGTQQQLWKRCLMKLQMWCQAGSMDRLLYPPLGRRFSFPHIPCSAAILVAARWPLALWPQREVVVPF